MPKFQSALTPELRTFIERQRLFFTATAPLSGEARINLSPKGMDTFRVLSDAEVAYLDLTGSGNETAAHIHENGRLTIMFCSFEGKPLILRLYGRGEVVLPPDPAWPELIGQFDEIPGQRQIIRLHIDSVQQSCGFGVPLYAFERHRETLKAWGESKGDDGLQKYWREQNQTSIDGLPTGWRE
jgi:hypothetical protein